MIDYATIERIQATAQIADVVSDFVSLKKTGSGFKGLCPFHEDRNPSLSVSPAKNIFKCFVCGEGGAPVHFIMKHEKISYPEALKYLARKYNIEIKETALSDEQKQERDARESMLILNEYAQKTFVNNLIETEEGRSVGLAYFRERGFRDDIIKKFNLGYAFDKRDAFTKRAIEAGYNIEFLEKTGLTIISENNYQADRFRGRVIFPIHSISGKTVGFGGRILLSAKTDKLAKYINSPDSEVYHKKDVLYGIFHARQAIAKQNKCFLVEGYTDVISMHQAGIENVVAPCGTALTEEQIRLIRRLTENITLLNDGDKAGKGASMKAIPLLLDAGMNIRIVVLPEGEDPDTFARSHNASAFNDYINSNETNFVLFKAGQLMASAGEDPAKKAQSITDITDTIALIKDEITRLAYVKECSRITGYDEETLIRRIRAKRQEIAVQKKKDLYPQAANPVDNPPPTDDAAVYAETYLYATPAQEESEGEPVSGDIDCYERSILRYIVRYGEVDMENVEEEEQTENSGSPKRKKKQRTPVFTVQYVAEEFEALGLSFTNPLYEQILHETFARYKNEGFVAETYFIHHPNPEISNLAIDLATDKYIESKIHSRTKRLPKEKEKLYELVPYVVINYKNFLLERQIKSIENDIQEAEKNNDSDRLISLINELQTISQQKKIIARALRERIIQMI
jgi:DNA primase